MTYSDETRELMRQGEALAAQGEELERLLAGQVETVVLTGPSDRQVALQAALALVTSYPSRYGTALDQVLSTADRFHTWLTQDEIEPFPHPDEGE
jgi:hypothetical protein